MFERSDGRWQHSLAFPREKADLAKRIDELAEERDRTASYIIIQAIENGVDDL